MAEKTETPYDHARAEWDSRRGSTLRQAQNWRLALFGSLLLNGLLVGGLLVQGQRPTAVPFVIKVDTLGQVQAVGLAEDVGAPTRASIFRTLTDFVVFTRSLPTDAVVLRRQWLQAYNVVTARGKAQLTAYAREVQPFGRLGQEAITVEVRSVLALTPESYEVQWRQSHYAKNGHKIQDQHWSGIFTLHVEPGRRSEEDIRKNPLGIYVDHVAWQRKLAHDA